MQPTANLNVGGSNPDHGGGGRQLRSAEQGSNRRPASLQSAALPFLLTSPHCLKPSEHKLLTHPPPQKSDIQFQGMVLLGKIMILQGVGHQISCLGVCYANDPRKGGYTTPAPALDLTTSRRGDFSLPPLVLVMVRDGSPLWGDGQGGGGVLAPPAHQACTL